MVSRFDAGCVDMSFRNRMHLDTGVAVCKVYS